MSILLFDVPLPCLNQVTRTLMGVSPVNSADPFWPYTAICSEVVSLEDASVWAVRNQIRAVETQRIPEGKPEPDYRRLHDIARHAIHVTETLDVVTETMDGIISQHQTFASVVPNHQIWSGVHQGLLSRRQVIRSLRHRSASNEKRLQNELQLAFNTVTQFDSGISVQVGRAAQADSSAMRTISILTLVFLPPTFICSLFSTSFFDYDTSSGWTVSSEFWIYWAFAIPTTMCAISVWYFWQTIQQKRNTW